MKVISREIRGRCPNDENKSTDTSPEWNKCEEEEEENKKDFGVQTRVSNDLSLDRLFWNFVEERF